jgi:hypothetical protein
MQKREHAVYLRVGWLHGMTAYQPMTHPFTITTHKKNKPQTSKSRSQRDVPLPHIMEFQGLVAEHDEIPALTHRHPQPPPPQKRRPQPQTTKNRSQRDTPILI